MNRSQYLDDLGREVGAACARRDVETGNCDRQAEASWSRAAWIDEFHAVTFGHQGFMRVSGNDDVEAGGARVDVHFLHIVEDVDTDTFQLQCEVKRDLRCPLALVVVPSDRIDGRNRAQLLENLGAADVACMNDVVNP